MIKIQDGAKKDLLPVGILHAIVANDLVVAFETRLGCWRIGLDVIHNGRPVHKIRNFIVRHVDDGEQ